VNNGQQPLELLPIMNNTNKAIAELDGLNEGFTGACEPQRVGNLAFQQDMNYRAALPWQCNRESVRNAMDAGASVVAVHPDWYFLKAQKDAGVPPEKCIQRWMIEDDGQGMTEEVQARFADLGVSTKGVSLDGHFGMGAKLSLLPGNHFGVLVISYQNGVGLMSVIMRFNLNGMEYYGPRRYEVEDENGNVEVVTVSPAPTMYDYYIGDKFGRDGTRRMNGTLLIALGETGEENTWDAFPSIPLQNTYISKHQHKKVLNERFYSFGSTRVWAWENTSNEPGLRAMSPLNNRVEGHNFGQYREVEGQKAVLTKESTHRGVVPIPEHGEVHLFLFDTAQLAHFQNSTSGRNYGSWGISSQRISVLYDDELYSHRTDPAHFRYFGIYQNSRHFVLLFKPDPQNAAYSTDLLRREIMYRSGNIPWATIGTRFQEAMPPEITKFLAKLAPIPKDLSVLREEVLERLRAKYRNRLPANARQLDGVTPRKRPTASERKRNPSQTQGTTPRKTLPDLHYVDKTDTPPRRPAYYQPGKLVVYTEHVCFLTLASYWCQRYGHVSDAELPGKVRCQTLAIAAETLMLYVTQVLNLKGTAGYNDVNIEVMLSEETLAGVAYQLHSGLLDDHIVAPLRAVYGKPSEAP
jgi:hypothetical protein